MPRASHVAFWKNWELPSPCLVSLLLTFLLWTLTLEWGDGKVLSFCLTLSLFWRFKEEEAFEYYLCKQWADGTAAQSQGTLPSSGQDHLGLILRVGFCVTWRDTEEVHSGCSVLVSTMAPNKTRTSSSRDGAAAVTSRIASAFNSFFWHKWRR